MCTGRVDLSFILRALSKGADGVFIGGCWPGECHYITEGNYDALANLHLCRKLLQRVGVDTGRLRLEWVAASEGSRFAEVMDNFVGTLEGLGPLGADGGDSALKGKLAAVERLVPYIKLVERERLRTPARDEEAVNAHYTSDEINRLFDELVGSKLVTSQILSLLGEGPRSTSQIAEHLELAPSEVSRHMKNTSRQGLVRFDVDQNRFVLA